MSEAWSEGYFTDVTYTSGYYRELSPVMIRFCLLLQKIMPPPAGDISYCELGFGQGLSLNIHAATVPGTFTGTDFNPAQTAEARRLCTASGSPLQLYNDSFEEFNQRDLPTFDYIGLHGIWSWINAKNRECIVNFVRTHLKAGGAFYISYNCHPGWAAQSPLRELLRLHDKHVAHGHSPSSRVQQAISFAERMFEAKPNYATAVGGIADRLGKMKSMPANYLCHEYFNENWDIMYFMDVADMLSSAKVAFSATANPLDSISGLGLSPEAQAFLSGVELPILREQLRDYFTNTQFRKDIFVSGGTPLSAVEQRNLLMQQRFVLVTHQYPDIVEVAAGMGKVALKPEVYIPVIHSLQENGYAPRTLQSIAEQLEKDGIERNQVLSSLILLTGAGLVSPCQPLEAEQRCTGTARACNMELCHKAHTSGENCFLASPVTGGGISMNRIEQLLLESWEKGGDISARVWTVMKENGERMVKNGTALEGDADCIKAIAEIAAEFEKRLPVLKALGIACM